MSGTLIPLEAEFNENEDEKVELQWSPTFCLGFLVYSAEAKKQLEPLVTWWQESGKEETAPPYLKLDDQYDNPALIAKFWQLISSRLMVKTENTAQRLTTLHRQYLSLRTLHENVQNAFAAVEDFLSQAKLPELQLKFENQPTKNIALPTPGSRFILKQLLPVGSRGLAAIDLHIGKDNPNSRGIIAIAVEIPEDRTCLAKWHVPYQHLKLGWLHLDLPSIDISFQREIQLKIEFKTQIGPAPCLSLGMLQPIPECQAYTEQDSFQRSLAFRLWTGLPGTRRVISPYSVTTTTTDISQAEPITSGYLGQRSLLSLQEVTPNLPTDDFPFIAVMEEGQKILLHPRKDRLTIAMLPYCFPAGASQLTATVATEHAEADVIEYAMAVIEEGMEPAAWFETGNLELAVAVAEWIALDPGTSGQLKLSIEPASTEYHHIVIATRLPPTSHPHFGWAHWLNFHIET